MRILAVVLLISGCAFGQCTATPPSQASGYVQQFCDNFVTLDVTTGNTPGHNWYNPGLYYAGASGSITDPSGTYVDLEWATAQGNFSTSMGTYANNLTSGRAWTLGYFEASIKFSASAGSWPGFFLLSPYQQTQSTNSTPYPEIDILEWQSNTPTLFYGTVHVWRSGNFIGSAGVDPAVAINDGNYHTYGLLWTSSSMSWYVDNVSQGSVNVQSYPFNLVYGGPPCSSSITTNCTNPMFLILTQQAGCNFTFDTPCTPIQTSPLDMQAAYVHVFQQPTLASGSTITGGSNLTSGVTIQ